jgi:peptidoglycan/xylan/chitin deacetylase (PgdA/CDA1 family)
MIRRLLRLLISMAYWCGQRFRDCVLFFLRRPLPGRCIIVYYHDVPSRYRERFERQMENLSRRYNVIPLESRHSLEPGGRCVVLTFDDGLMSAAENAFPVLEKRQIPVAVFIPAGRLGEILEKGSDDPVMTAEMLVALNPAIFTIGSHGLTHSDLTALSDAAARDEIVKSRTTLSDFLKRDVQYMSFPFGSFREQHILWAREAGYEHLFTSFAHPAFTRPDEFVSGRVQVHPKDWWVEFRLKTVGGYSWLGSLSYRSWKVGRIGGRLLNLPLVRARGASGSSV